MSSVAIQPWLVYTPADDDNLMFETGVVQAVKETLLMSQDERKDDDFVRGELIEPRTK